jgi:pentatricopeptide repeat protein
MKNSLLNMYSKCGSMDNILELFKQMKDNRLQTNQIFYTIALSACTNLVVLSLKRKIHSEIDELGVEWNIEMKISLLNMYSKYGSMDEICSIFDKIQSKNIVI